ncbi:hypothetical protein WMY93_022647 [Mugilogobius chulae]|uniref:Uncharacterized protein n=1 Tax=Mugilogobius chulae TaxID=88201 RepID=A0AAW0NCE5_9GOBI
MAAGAGEDSERGGVFGVTELQPQRAERRQAAPGHTCVCLILQEEKNCSRLQLCRLILLKSLGSCLSSRSRSSASALLPLTHSSKQKAHTHLAFLLTHTHPSCHQPHTHTHPHTPAQAWRLHHLLPSQHTPPSALPTFPTYAALALAQTGECECEQEKQALSWKRYGHLPLGLTHMDPLSRQPKHMQGLR